MGHPIKSALKRNRTFRLALVAVFFFALLFSSSLAAAPTTAITPDSETGRGNLSLSVTESTSNYAIYDMNTTNSLEDLARSDGFSVSNPSGYTPIWQNITILDLRGTNDTREIQGGTSTRFKKCGKLNASESIFPGLAMSFVPVEKVNLTGVYLYYATTRTPPAIPLNITNDAYDGFHHPGSQFLGSGTLTTGVGEDWHYVSVKSPSGHPVTLEGGVRYWFVMNASSIPYYPSPKYYSWYYVLDPNSPSPDSKLACYYTLSWWEEEATGETFNFLTLARVLPVDSDLRPMAYNSPDQVNMTLITSSGTSYLTSNTTIVDPSVTSFTFVTNTSVTFSVNRTARFGQQYPIDSPAKPYYKANTTATYWSFNFTSRGASGAGNFFNHTFKVDLSSTVQSWSISDILVNESISFSYDFTGNILVIDQGSSLVRALWTVEASSTYAATVAAPDKVIAGLVFRVQISSSITPGYRRVQIHNASGDLTDEKSSFSSSTFDFVLTRVGNYYLTVFVNTTINECSFTQKPFEVVQPTSNITVVERNNPILGNNVTLRFKFYNTTLGNGAVMEPDVVSFNGTVILTDYDDVTGVTSIELRTFPGRWHAGNNTLVISAEHSVYNSTLETWVEVAQPLSNITVVECINPILGNNASLRFRFYNTTFGGAVILRPTTVSVNGTSISFDYDAGNGVTSITLNSTWGEFHIGSNIILLSAVQGLFNNATETGIFVYEPLSNLTVVDRVNPILGNNGSLSFKFYNTTLGSGRVLKPEAVSINGTPTYFTYDPLSGKTSIGLNSSSGFLRLGYNTILLSATHGFYYNVSGTWIVVIQPISNVTPVGRVNPILGNNAELSFKFFNITLGGSGLLEPEKVSVNGTLTLFTYNPSSGVASIELGTGSGAWHVGNNTMRVSVKHGFFNSTTLTWIEVIRPECTLKLNSSTLQAIWGDKLTVEFQFLNTTLSGQRPFPSSPHVEVNGSVVLNLVSVGEGNYSFDYLTWVVRPAGNYSLVISVSYGAYYYNETVLNLQLMRIPMVVSIMLEQTSVYVGSSLSVTAVLAYSNGTLAPDGLNLQFEFTVSYKNESIVVITKTGAILNGSATSSLQVTGDMQSITVRVIYGGDGIRASASDTKPPIAVTQPTTGGFPVILIAGAGGVGALVVGLAVGVVRRRKRGKEVEYKKTAALRQAASLAQLVVVDRKSGRAVFSRNLSTEETVDPHLISGFLSANESVLQEVFRGEKTAGLKFADYGKYKVLTSVGDYVMTTLFCAVGADKQLEGVLELEDVLSKFTKEFERKYGRLVSVWDGDMAAFRGAENIVSDVFAQGISMLSPYMLNQEALAKAKLSGLESDACQEARRLSAGRGVFFITKVIEYLLTEKGVSRGKLMDTINSLVKRGVFKQLSMTEAEEIVKAGGLKRQ